MKQNKHTPGPWKSNPYQHSVIHGFAVYSDKVCLDKVADGIKSEANAHLIAAAPEMLDALESVLFYLESFQSIEKSKDREQEKSKIKGAIAKARGLK